MVDPFPDPCNLIVNYIPTPVTDAELYGMFTQYGELVSARVIVDRVSGHPKGYGFVKYKNYEDASQAMARMNGFQIHGKRLKVTPARGFQSNIIDAYPPGGAMRQPMMNPGVMGADGGMHGMMPGMPGHPSDGNVPMYDPSYTGPSLELASNNQSPYVSHYNSTPPSLESRSMQPAPVAPEPQAVQAPAAPAQAVQQAPQMEIPAGAPPPPPAF